MPAWLPVVLAVWAVLALTGWTLCRVGRRPPPRPPGR